MLILFSGVPCSGKSTLTMQTAEHLRVPYFSRDSLQSFLFQRNLIKGNTIDGYLLMLKLAEEQLKLGISVILDGAFPLNDFRQQAQDIANRYDVKFKPIYCSISDRELWHNRWHQRRDLKTASHWMDFTWDDVLRIENYFQAWETVDILSVDAVNPMEKNFKLVKDYLNR